MSLRKRIWTIMLGALFVVSVLTLSSFASDIKNTGGDGNNVISLDKANAEFLKYGQPRLMFVRPWNTSNEAENRQLKLVYSLVGGPYYYFDFSAIDASAGKPINSAGKVLNLYYERIGDVTKAEADKVSEELVKPLDENSAKEIAIKESEKYDIHVDDLKNYSSTTNDNWYGLDQKVFTFTWSNKSDNNKLEDNCFFKTTVDALTGDVLEVYHKVSKMKMTSGIDTSGNITWLEGKNNAINYLGSKFPQFNGKLVFMQSEPTQSSKNNEYYYSFWRAVGGVLYPENNVNIIVNSATGDVIGCGYRWENIEFPAVNGNIISQTEASNIFINQVGLKLNKRVYATTGAAINNAKINDSKSDNLISQDVYEANNIGAAYIDPYTGKIKDIKGQDINAEK